MTNTGWFVRRVFSPPADLQVNTCYFCQSWQSASPPSIPQCPLTGYQDGLFLLCPNETPPCAAKALLLFCIDISGSMSITSQVRTAWLTAICSLFVTAGVHKAELRSFMWSVSRYLFQGVRGGASCPQIPSAGESFQVSFELCEAENEHTNSTVGLLRVHI